MKRTGRTIIIVSLVFVAIAVPAVTAACATLKDLSAAPRPALRASTDPAVVARGEYLVHAVAHCSACHGPAAVVRQRQLGPRDDLSGGRVYQLGPIGQFAASNLSSDPATGIGGWSDEDLARALRHSVGKDGTYKLFMAFNTGPMVDDDLVAIISYLRTLPPRPNAVAAADWGLMGKLMFGGSEPRVAEPPPYAPEGETSIERGRYIANGPGLCFFCHTDSDPMSGKENKPRFSGGTPFPDEDDEKMELTPPNLTPDPKTGVMASWTEDQFVERFRAGRKVKGSFMAWDNYAQLTESDLRSLYRYFQSLPPVKNAVGPGYRPVGTTVGSVSGHG